MTPILCVNLSLNCWTECAESLVWPDGGLQDVSHFSKSHSIVPHVIKESQPSLWLSNVSTRESNSVTAVPKSSCGHCKISDKEGSKLDIYLGSCLCSSVTILLLMAGCLSLTVLQALYLHAHRVSISLCNSLGGPWNISICISSQLWCTYDPDTKTYSFCISEKKQLASGMHFTLSTNTKFKQCALQCT